MTFVRRYMGPENKLFHERIMIKTLPVGNRPTGNQTP